MKIFINDIPVSFLEHVEESDKIQFDTVFDTAPSKIETKKFNDKVLVLNANITFLVRLIEKMTDKKFKNTTSITCVSSKIKKLKKFVKLKFKIIEAAGGIVMKDNKILVMFRKGLWDLPKGKLHKNEKSHEGALREVEEETGAKVELVQMIGKTWHTYIHNRKYVIKKTYWYEMKCIDDKNLNPQKEENIEELKWMTPQESLIALRNSYQSLYELFIKFLNQHNDLNIS